MTLLAPCSSPVAMTWTGPLNHLCPFVPEVDEGTVTITWITAGATLELHALAAWLGDFAGDKVSHEDITEDIRAALNQLAGIAGVDVTTRWTTAGGEVVVRAVPRERLIGSGA